MKYDDLTKNRSAVGGFFAVTGALILFCIYIVALAIYSITIWLIPGKCEYCLKKYNMFRRVLMEGHAPVVICRSCNQNQELPDNDK